MAEQEPVVVGATWTRVPNTKGGVSIIRTSDIVAFVQDERSGHWLMWMRGGFSMTFDSMTRKNGQRLADMIQKASDNP